VQVFKDLKQEFEAGSLAEKLEVLKALQTASDFQSVSLLIHALEDPDHDVRETARDILRSRYPTRDEKGESDRDYWARMMERDDLP
jgi:hypothetical protein